MKKICFLLILLLTTSMIFAEKKAILYFEDGNSISGQLLYGTDSLLYVWTGLSEFNLDNIQHVKAFPYSDIIKIDLNRSITWKQGILKALPVTFLASATIAAINFQEQNLTDILAFGAFFNIVFSIPTGAVISIESHFRSDLITPSPELFDLKTGKFRRYLLIDGKQPSIVETLISEVKP